MKKTILKIVLVLSLSLIALQPGLAQEIKDDAYIVGLLKERIDKLNRGVGSVVGIIDKNGTRIVSYGHFTTDKNRPVDGETLFEIGSITKVFTSILLADMAARGEVALDDPVAKFLPGTVKIPTRGDKQITLYNLSVQDSALPRMPNNFRPADTENPYADYSVEQMYEFLSGLELGRDIGQKFEYSNLGVGLLGHALALRAGKSYEELVRERILDPLGMKDTVIVLSDGLKSQFATGHTQAGYATSPWDIPTLAGAGALRSTVKDMLKFLAANMGLTKTSLSPAMNESHEAQIETGRPNVEIGLNWIVQKKHGTEIIWHNGGTGGFRSFLGFDKENGIGIVILTNSGNGSDDIGFHLLNEKYEIPKLTPVPKPRKIVKLGSGIFDRYIGDYQLTPAVVMSITGGDNRYYVQLTGQQKIAIFPESETKFFAKLVDAQIGFFEGENGEIEHLILYQNGIEQKATRK